MRFDLTEEECADREWWINLNFFCVLRLLICQQTVEPRKHRYVIMENHKWRRD